MGLPIFREPAPAAQDTSKTKTDPTAYARGIRRRHAIRDGRSRLFIEEVAGSAARALPGDPTSYPVTGALRRTQTTYGTDNSFEELRLRTLQEFETFIDEPASTTASTQTQQRPRSRRGPNASSVEQTEAIADELFPPLRRVPGRSHLRLTPREAFDALLPPGGINGLGDRQRSVSPGAPEWTSYSLEEMPRPQSPPPVSSPAPIYYDFPITGLNSSADSPAANPSGPLLAPRAEVTRSLPPPRTLPPLRTSADPTLYGPPTHPLSPTWPTRDNMDSLFCDDANPDDIIPSSTSIIEVAEQTSYERPHHESMAVLREAAHLINNLEGRLQTLAADGAHDIEVETITSELETLAARLRQQEQRLWVSLTAMQREGRVVSAQELDDAFGAPGLSRL